ncbi:MAG: hypothetical protein LBQ09_00270 [Acidobacteriaceae bacterium]|jgi:hypothetical protein|nr:hypothetical protein [Acidobacteriaceae bacterium]
MARLVKRLTVLAGAGLLIAIAGTSIDAHKAITSVYTYDDDIYPILKEKCGNCHITGGPAPMSLLTYSDDGGAVAWAESIKEMLITQAMPPYFADPTGPSVKNVHTLTARELDKLLTWAGGGTPQGDLNKKPKPSTLHADWTLGKPDATVPMDKDVTLGPGEMEKNVDVVLPTGFTDAKMLKAVDLLPGNATLVRQATISVENGPVLWIWQPGDDKNAAPEGTGFALPAGAKLRLQVRYKKPWEDEQETRTDKSTIGLYFAPAGKAIQSLVIDGPKTLSDGEPVTFSGKTTAAGRVLALRTFVDQPYGVVTITAVSPSGERTPLLKLRAPRPEWPRRYWLTTPVTVPAGATIEVTTTAPPDPSDDTGPLGPKFQSPFQIALDYVGQ